MAQLDMISQKPVAGELILTVKQLFNQPQPLRSTVPSRERDIALTSLKAEVTRQKWLMRF